MGVKARISPQIKQLAAEQAIELPPVEAAHVEAVLQTAVDKLAIIGMINMDPRSQALELTQHVGEEISRMITQQKNLESRFQELIKAQPALRGMNNQAYLAANQAELVQVSEQLRQATKQLCRNLKDNPNVSDNLAKVSSERQALQVLLMQALGDIGTRGVAVPLIEAVLAADQAQVEMRTIIEAERSASSAVKQLKSDIKEEKGEHEERIRTSRKSQARLKDQLRQEQLHNAVDARYHERTLAAANQAAARMDSTSLMEMAHELALIRLQINIEKAVASAAVSHLEASATALTAAKEDWEARQDEDSRAKERAAEMLTAQRIRELEVLRRVELDYKEQLAGRMSREAAKQAERDAAAAAAGNAILRERAAAVIQAAWRGYKARAGAKGGGKKDKKGKKGGKAGKKGKKK